MCARAWSVWGRGVCGCVCVGGWGGWGGGRVACVCVCGNVDVRVWITAGLPIPNTTRHHPPAYLGSSMPYSGLKLMPVDRSHAAPKSISLIWGQQVCVRVCAPSVWVVPGMMAVFVHMCAAGACPAPPALLPRATHPSHTSPTPPTCPSAVRMMFSGLMSRCTMPSECRRSRAAGGDAGGGRVKACAWHGERALLRSVRCCSGGAPPG